MPSCVPTTVSELTQRLHRKSYNLSYNSGTHITSPQRQTCDYLVQNSRDIPRYQLDYVLCSYEDDDLVNHLHYSVSAQQSVAKSSFQAFHSIKNDFTKLKPRRVQISKSIILRSRLTATMYASPCKAPSSLDIWNMSSPFKSTIRWISAWKA